MRNLRAIVSFVLLSVAILALAACGSSGGTASSDPYGGNKSNPDTGSKTGPIFGNVSTVTGKTGITLSTDVTSLGADNGQVVLTAKVVSNGVGVPGVPVKFSIVAPVSGPATIEPGLTEVSTDSNGIAISRVTTGTATSTTNVIVAATATIGKQSATANATFQIVRGTGVISVGAIPVKTETVDAAVQPTVVFQQQIPVALTDANGNPRVGTPITMSVYTKTGTSTVSITQQTVPTDSGGGAIFNTTVTIPSPPAGTNSVSSIVYKFATSDTNPVHAYGASYFTVISNPAAQSGANIILTTDRSSYDTNDDSVLVTAKVTQNGAGVYATAVNFLVLAGPATVQITPVSTDSNGVAYTKVKTGSVTSTTNVILMARSMVGSSQVTAYATFQLVPTLNTQAPSTLTLTPDKTSTGPQSTVVLTATLNTPSQARLAQNQPVTFSLVGGALGTFATNTVYTDSTGKAVNQLKVLDTSSSSSIIVQARTTINDTVITAYTTIKVVRQNSLVINFLTSKDPTDPDGTLNRLLATLPWDTTATRYGFVQIVPFEVLDQNGVPMPNVLVSLSYTKQQASTTVEIKAPTTVKTDDHGRGMFSITIMMNVPPLPGTQNSDVIIYTAKATALGQELTAYGGLVATVEREKKP